MVNQARDVKTMLSYEVQEQAAVVQLFQMQTLVKALPFSCPATGI